MAKASQPRRERRAAKKELAALAPELTLTDVERLQLSEVVLKQTVANSNFNAARVLYQTQCQELTALHQAWMKRVSSRLGVSQEALVAHYLLNPDDNRVVLKTPEQMAAPPEGAA